MSKYCVVCGKPLRTGYKYCHEHRNHKATPRRRKLTREERRQADKFALGAMLVVFAGTIFYFTVKFVKENFWAVLFVLSLIGFFIWLWFWRKRQIREGKWNKEIKFKKRVVEE